MNLLNTRIKYAKSMNYENYFDFVSKNKISIAKNLDSKEI
jgi:hypothetical protein